MTDLKPNEAYLDVYIDSIDPLNFRVEPSNKNGPPLPTGPHGIIFENGGRPGFHVRFTLQGDTHGFLFPKQKDAKKAVWSKLGSTCPDEGAWEVFTAPTVSPDGKVLKVVNLNPHPAQGPFKYTLRVTDGSCWKDLDPGGLNSNGLVRSNDSSVVTYAAITVTTIALVVAITETFHITNFFR